MLSEVESPRPAQAIESAAAVSVEGAKAREHDYSSNARESRGEKTEEMKAQV